MDVVLSDEYRAKFLDKVHVCQETGCWIWQGSRSMSTGKWVGAPYGLFFVKNQTFRAHRVAYRMFVGDLVEGLQIDHLCRNRLCVNPAHLEQVTQYENMMRGYGKSRLNRDKTHCNSGHPLSGENLGYDENGRRQCLTCLKRRQTYSLKTEAQKIRLRERDRIRAANRTEEQKRRKKENDRRRRQSKRAGL